MFPNSPVQEPAPVPRVNLPPQSVLKGLLRCRHCLVNITHLGQGHLADDLWKEQRFDSLPWLPASSRGHPEAGSPPYRLALREVLPLVAREESAKEGGAVRRSLHIPLTFEWSPKGLTAQLHLRSPGSLVLITMEAEIHWLCELSQKGFYTQGVCIQASGLIGPVGCDCSQGESEGLDRGARQPLLVHYQEQACPPHPRPRGLTMSHLQGWHPGDAIHPACPLEFPLSTSPR